ncbi:hypothetical protein A6A04_13270 [Paramagnetospirillum marisnigri]|uniref:Uncharacterized protein n=1 Tax=Paramagnetospirillum marisnigri TaxID=1285242 RepID=A0A178MUW1_9PROT|nr:ASCH domain-containing protein [Paramagnetospirillum marisnigri]OAN53857.1 hypothetical protein A6A04_13270 [Paramagnetospirillum marisnigri]
MRAITLHQPWASLIAIGAKKFETRSFPPPSKLIGQRIAIHAAVRKCCLDDLELDVESAEMISDALGKSAWNHTLPHGAVVCTAVLAGAYKVASLVEDEAGGTIALFDLNATLKGSPFSSSLDVDPFGDYSVGRWCWLLKDVQRLPEPVPAKGKQGWWEWSQNGPL